MNSYQLLLSLFLLLFCTSCQEGKEQKAKEKTESPIEKKKAKAAEEKNSKGGFIVKVKPFQTDGGWGYDIYRNGKKVIHQDHIPVVQGVKPFPSKSAANQIGELMAHKIRKGIMPPSVTEKELDSLGVVGED